MLTPLLFFISNLSFALTPLSLIQTVSKSKPGKVHNVIKNTFGVISGAKKRNITQKQQSQFEEILKRLKYFVMQGDKKRFLCKKFISKYLKKLSDFEGSYLKSSKKTFAQIKKELLSIIAEIKKETLRLNKKSENIVKTLIIIVVIWKIKCQ